MDSDVCLGSYHLHVSMTDCPEESKDGKRLIELGFHDDNEYWSKFV